LETAKEGILNYAKFYPNTVFLLIDETNELLALGVRWDGENYYYAQDSIGMDVSYMFQHDHDHSEA